jgi:glycosyltransferase involved in cell wall biosynthesis
LSEAEGIFGIYLREPWVQSSRLKGFVAFWTILPVTLWQLWRFLQREQVDIVHLHFVIPASLYFVALRHFCRWKLLATFHGTDGYALSRRSRWHRLLVRSVVSRVDLVTTVSADLLRTVRAMFPDLRVESRVILNGNPVLTRAPEGPGPNVRRSLPDRYVLAVGSLIPRKGYDILVKAVGLVRDRGCLLNVVIVGDGPEASRLAILAKDLAVEEQVFFAGDRSQAEVLQFYPRARFFVHTAREEAFGLVLLEAMAFGKAVIAPRVGGIPEFVRHGETGLLVKPDDPAALAEAMIVLDGDEAFRDKLAAGGHYAATTEHSWNRVVGAYKALYLDVLRESARHAD